MTPSANGLKKSPLKQTELQLEEETALDWTKVQVMDHLRLMEDNQRTLNTAHAADRLHRRRQNKFSDAIAAGLQNEQPSAGEAQEGDFQVDDAMSTYRIDSPDESHVHYHSAPQVQPAPTLASKIAPLLAAGGLMAGAGSAGYLLKSAIAPPSIVNTEKKSGFTMEFVPPEKPK